MNVALIGYGKMGQMIERLAEQKGVKIISTIDPVNPKAKFKEINSQSLAGVDVAIDFTHPSTVLDNVKKVSALKVPLVLGTTGWHDKMMQVKQIVEENDSALLWAANFSISVALFTKIVGFAAQQLSTQPDFDVAGYEVHHNQKADAPGGTALQLANEVLKNFPRKNKIVSLNPVGKVASNELNLSAVRVGFQPGSHAIVFDSPSDTIRLEHTARNREAFAYGALAAAEFIKGKKGFYSINDLL